MRLLLWVALALVAGLIWFLRSRVPFESDGAGSSPIGPELPAGNTSQLGAESQTAPMRTGGKQDSVTEGRAQKLHAELMGLSKELLYERARRLDIPGRSRMGKQALIRAIAAREGRRSRPQH